LVFLDPVRIQNPRIQNPDLQHCFDTGSVYLICLPCHSIPVAISHLSKKIQNSFVDMPQGEMLVLFMPLPDFIVMNEEVITSPSTFVKKRTR
jgi:hypothetical protein